MEKANEQKQQQARNLYLHTDKTQKEIADILDVNSKTLYLWIKHNRWEEMKIAARQSPMCMIQDMYNHIQAVNNGIYAREDKCPTHKEVDMLKKLASTAKLLEAKHLGLYIETFMELISFINATDRELAIKVTPIADRYIKAKISKLQKFTPDDDIRVAKENLKTQELEEKEELEKHKATIICDPVCRQVEKEPVPNTVGGANSHQTIQPLSHCALEPLNESRAQSGMTPTVQNTTNPNTDNTFTKYTNSSMPEKTQKNHHYHNPRFKRRA